MTDLFRQYGGKASEQLTINTDRWQIARVAAALFVVTHGA